LIGKCDYSYAGSTVIPEYPTPVGAWKEKMIWKVYFLHCGGKIRK